MTAGALLQLKYATADRMAFLTLNPSISHFKNVYRKYTNFSMEYIEILPESGNKVLNFDNDVDITFKIGRDGDLVKDMCITLDLPDIYSTSAYSFQWISRLGEYLIKEVSVSIDNQTDIDKHYSEWFHIYSEMMIPYEKKYGYYDMIGNIKEYYDPANGAGCGGTYPGGDRINKRPSIVGRKIILPLHFWFNNNAFNSFPLIATQRMEFFIKIKLRKLKEVFTIINQSTGYRIQPTSSHYFGQFLYANDTSNSLNINIKMEINYIFLDNDERKRFALSNDIEYLIMQLQKIESYNTGNSNNIKIDIKNINKPVTDLYFIIRRTDFEEANQWSNFTNWTDNIPPFRSAGYINIFGPSPNITASNIAIYKTPYILKSAQILIEGQELTRGSITNFDTDEKGQNGKDSFFYNYIQPYTLQNNIPNIGIYSYSFSLNKDNKLIQPNGCINMSSIQSKMIIINTTNIDTTRNWLAYNSSYNYHIYVFAINYEIVKILGGMFNIVTIN